MISDLPKNYPQNICAYCGSSDNLQNDHVPPKNLFTKPRPELITVKACKACHSVTSKDDEYFRIKICIRNDAYRHPEARKSADTIFRSLKRETARGLRNQFLADFRNLNLQTRSGIYVGKRLGYNVDLVRIRRVVERVVRGLYFAESGKPLGLNNEVRVFTSEELEAQPKDILDQLKNTILVPITALQPKIIGKDVFFYRHHIAPEDPIVSVWVISFYKQVPFFIMTGHSMPLPQPTTIKTPWLT